MKWTGNQLVRSFVEQDILTQIAGPARHRRFRFDAYGRLFEDEADA